MSDTLKLIRNAIRTPDGTVLVSYSRHDYVTHTDEVTKEEYMLDGGLSYIRSSVNEIPAVSLCLYNDQPHEIQREVFKWGTYGKDGDQPLTFKPVSLMDTGHIEAVLRECTPAPVIADCMKEELKRREAEKCKTGQ